MCGLLEKEEWEMQGLLLVGAGGALGAMGRYGISQLPWKGAFPLWTLCVNFLGAVAIGFLRSEEHTV